MLDHVRGCTQIGHSGRVHKNYLIALMRALPERVVHSGRCAGVLLDASLETVTGTRTGGTVVIDAAAGVDSGAEIERPGAVAGSASKSCLTDEALTSW